MRKIKSARNRSQLAQRTARFRTKFLSEYCSRYMPGGRGKEGLETG